MTFPYSVHCSNSTLAIIGGPNSPSKSKLFLYDLKTHQSSEAIISGAAQVNNPHDVAISEDGQQVVVANLKPNAVWVFENPDRRSFGKAIGNVQFWLISWQFCTLDGVLIITYKSQKNHEKIREILFTFKLHSAVVLSIWRDFLLKIPNSNFGFIEIISETVFTFKLHSADFLSFWRDFLQKFPNSNFGFIEKIPWNFVYI